MNRWAKGDRLDEKEDDHSDDRKRDESKDESRSRSRRSKDEPIQDKTESTKGLSDRFETRGELRAVEEYVSFGLILNVFKIYTLVRG
jgi:hypothetical protein